MHDNTQRPRATMRGGFDTPAAAAEETRVEAIAQFNRRTLLLGSAFAAAHRGDSREAARRIVQVAEYDRHRTPEIVGLTHRTEQLARRFMAALTPRAK